MSFILKLKRIARENPEAQRPINLTFFLLKALERLVDRYIRDGRLDDEPLHILQPGKSIDSALHNIFHKLEKASEHMDLAVGLFPDIDTSFNHTSITAIDAAAERHGVDTAIRMWIKNMLLTRPIRVERGVEETMVVINRGCLTGE